MHTVHHYTLSVIDSLTYPSVKCWSFRFAFIRFELIFLVGFALSGSSHPVWVIPTRQMDQYASYKRLAPGGFWIRPQVPWKARGWVSVLAAVSCSHCYSNTKIRLPLVFFECSIRKKTPQTCKTRLLRDSRVGPHFMCPHYFCCLRGSARCFWGLRRIFRVVTGQREPYPLQRVEGEFLTV